MKVIVTGATGFVGNALAKQLSKDNEVTVIVRSANKLSADIYDKVNIIELDMCDYSEYIPKLSDYDVFYHFAWNGTSGPLRKDSYVQSNNVIYTCDAVRLANRFGCKRFVNACSIMEYECIDGFLKQSDFNETYIYNISKLAADYESQIISNALGMDYIGVVISNIFGCGEISYRFVNYLIRKFLLNEDVDLTSCEQLYDFIYIDDAIRAIIYAANKGINNSHYYIGNKELNKLKYFVLKIYEICESKSVLRFGAIDNKVDDGYYSNIDLYGLYNLGYNTEISFEDGITKTKEWIRNYGNEF